MRIILFNDSFPPIIDGVANAVINYGTYLTQMGHECLVATPAWPGQKDDYPFPVVRFASKASRLIRGYRTGNPLDVRAIRTLVRFRPDLLHAHCPTASYVMARLVRRSTGAPLITTYHTKYDVDIRSAQKGRLIQDAMIRLVIHNFDRSDEIWAVSRGAGENLLQNGSRRNYLVMENGVDMAPGPSPEPVVAALRAQYGLTEGAPVLLYVGRLRWYKNIQLILESLAEARRQGLRFRMVFVGDGSDGEAIRQAASEIGLADVCVFVGPVTDRERLKEWYSAADLFVFPSTFDTNGIVVREAASCALPALLVRGSCAAEGITDGENGFLVEESVPALCQGLLCACREPQRLRQVGQCALQQLYISWEEAVNRAARRYTEVLQARGKLPRA